MGEDLKGKSVIIIEVGKTEIVCCDWRGTLEVCVFVQDLRAWKKHI